MKHSQKSLVDYAPKVITLEQYMLLFSYDLDTIGSPVDSKASVSRTEYVKTYHPLEQQNFETRERKILSARVRRFTHEEFGIYLEKLKNRIYLTEYDANVINLYDHIWIVPEEDIYIDMILRGDVVAVRDCSREVVFYTNPYRVMENDFFATNMLGENIYDTVVCYENLNVIDKQLKK